jgi:ADP-ribose pyrophosphatase
MKNDTKPTQSRPWQPQFSVGDVNITGDKLLAASFYQFREITLEHSRFNGGLVKVKRDLFCRPNAVAVLLHDVKRDVVVMIEQFRIGALDHPRSPWLLEIVAGIVDEGENIEAVAMRESIEETGLELLSLEHIYQYSPSPGGAKEVIDLFYAQVDSTNAEGVHGLESEGEDIKVHVIPTKQAFNLLKTGVIDNSPAIIALQWLQLNQ